MAAFVHTDARILFNAHDISGDSNQYEMSPSCDVKDVSTFGTEWIKRKGGIRTFKHAASGFLNNTPATLFTDLVTATPWTTVTSAAAGFTKEMVGETLTITGGHANINVGNYTVKTFNAANSITLATACGDTGPVATGAGYIRGVKNIHALVGTDENEVMVIPQGFTDGNEALFGQVSVAEYMLGGAFGEVCPWSFTAEGHKEFVGGWLIEQATKNVAAPTNSSTLTIAGGVAAGQTLWAQLHVLNCTGTAPTIDAIVQSGDGLGGWGDNRITFPQQNARTSLIMSDTGVSADTDFRLNVTIGGAGALDVHYVCAIGIVGTL